MNESSVDKYKPVILCIFRHDDILHRLSSYYIGEQFVVMGIYERSRTEDENGNDLKNKIKVIIAKNNYGTLGGK